jgi:hypothetical protein
MVMYNVPGWNSVSAEDLKANRTMESHTLPRKHIKCGDPVSSFSWHNGPIPRFAAVTLGNTVEDIPLYDHIPVDFAPDNSFCLALSDLVHADLSDPSMQPVTDDISVYMRTRANAGYSLSCVENSRLAEALFRTPQQVRGGIVVCVGIVICVLCADFAICYIFLIL